MDGFMVSKVLPRSAAPAWWIMIEFLPDETDAIRQAVTLALADGTRVWFQEGPGHFRPVETSPTGSALPPAAPRLRGGPQP
jgi:hypothetical protein